MAVLTGAVASTGSAQMIYDIPPNGTSDGTVLHNGDKLLFENGASHNNAATINAASHCLIGGKTADAAPAHIKIPSPTGHNVNGVAMGHTDGVVVQALIVECLGGKSAAAVDAGRSKNAHVTNVTQAGCGWALRADRAEDLFADMISSGGLASEYCMGAFGGQDADGVPYFNRNCTIVRFDLVAGMGVKGLSDHGAMHAIRWEHSINTIFGSLNPAVRLPAIANLPGPDGRGFAARIVQASDYDGCAMAINDASGHKAYRILSFGKVAVGPLPEDIAHYPNRRNKDAVWDGWEMNGLFVANKGTENFTWKNSLLRAVKKQNRNYDLHHLQGSAIQLAPDTSGSFDHCTFIQLAQPSFPSGWKHTNCKWSSNWDGSNARALL